MCAPTGHCLCGMGGLLTDIYATDLVGTFFGGFVYVPCVMVKARAVGTITFTLCAL